MRVMLPSLKLRLSKPYPLAAASVYRLTSILCLLTILAMLAAPGMLLHTNCSQMASDSCAHCHHPANSIQTIPFCCSASQSIPATLPVAAITLEAHITTSAHLPALNTTAPSLQLIDTHAAAPPPPLSRLILRI